MSLALFPEFSSTSDELHQQNDFAELYWRWLWRTFGKASVWCFLLFWRKVILAPTKNHSVPTLLNTTHVRLCYTKQKGVPEWRQPINFCKNSRTSESETLCKKQFTHNPLFERLLLKPMQCFKRWIFHPWVSNCTVHNNEIWIKEFITGLKRSTDCIQLPLSPAQEIKIISSIWNAGCDLMWPSSQWRHRKLSTI